MWFFENEKPARKLDGQTDTSADNIVADEYTNTPQQSSLENLLDRRIEHHSYRFAKSHAYPY